MPVTLISEDFEMMFDFLDEEVVKMTWYDLLSNRYTIEDISVYVDGRMMDIYEPISFEALSLPRGSDLVFTIV